MSQDRPFRLMDLPLEVRAMIFSEMLIEEKWIFHCDVNAEAVPHTQRKENVGCIKIEALEADEYDSLSMKRTSFLDGRYSHQFTTHTLLTGKENIHILQTNRQIYQEASAIFYSRNMFNFEGPPPVVAVPFMKGRGTRSLDSLRRLSIMYPSAMVNPKAVGKGKHHSDSTVGDERMWEELCCHISLHLPRLIHLDLRVERDLGIYLDVGVYLKAHEYTMEEWKSLQTVGDFPSKRTEELATLRPETKLTVSMGGFGWADLNALGIIDHDGYEDVVFTPLHPWLEESISRFRTQNIPFLASDEHPRITIREFWDARRRARTNRIYRVESSSDDDDDLDDDDEFSESTDS